MALTDTLNRYRMVHREIKHLSLEGTCVLLLTCKRASTPQVPPPPPPPPAPAPPAAPWVATNEMGFWEKMHGDPASWPVAIEMSGHVDTIIRYWDEFKLRVILPNMPVHVFCQVLSTTKT
jgi:hypothetical protein